MTTFKTWAPRATKIEVVIGENRYSMNPAGRGWWKVEIAEAGSGTDYAFSIDDQKPLPDPRSGWQPSGVHGPSRLLDHTRYQWEDKGWQPPPLSSAIIYELHLGTLTPAGTYISAIERLDDLRELGITHIELMPVNEFSGPRGWGYDGVDIYAPHHAYGTPDDLKQFVDACHQRGLAVLLDVVYNHFGPSGNYWENFGPYFSQRHHTPWGNAVNLDGPGSDDVRRFFIDNALMWLRDYRFDGLRLDATHAIVDTSALHFLEELASEVRLLEAQTGRHKVIIAESNRNDPRLVKSPQAGGYGLDAMWSDDFHHALHTVLTGESKGYYADFGSISGLAKSLKEAFVYDGRFSVFRNRRHGRSAAGLSGHRFLGYLQNHDQVGNRARGDRSSQILNEGRQKIGAALVLFSPFIPMLFQGEEWAASTPFQYFTSHPEPDLAQAVREGRKREFASFGWNPDQIPDPQAESTFENSVLKWEERKHGKHAAMLGWYRSLIALRRGSPALLDGRLDKVSVRYDEEAKWLAVKRGEAELLCNLAQHPQTLQISGEQENGDILLSSDPNIKPDEEGIRLPPDSVAIVAGEG